MSSLVHRHTGSCLTIAAALAVLAAASPPARADVVIVHDRSSKIRLGGADAAEIAGLGAEVVRQSRYGGVGPSADEVRALRATEIVVEVHYDQAQELALGQGAQWTRPQHLLIPLTGDLVGPPDGDTADVFGGRTALSNEPHYLGLTYANPPHEYDVLYTVTYRGGSLWRLRAALARIGVYAPLPEPPH